MRYVRIRTYALHCGILRYALLLVLRLAVILRRILFLSTKLHIASGYPSFVLGLRGLAEYLMKILLSFVQVVLGTFNVPAHVRGVPGCSVSFASGRTTGIARDSGDGLSHSVSYY